MFLYIFCSIVCGLWTEANPVWESLFQTVTMVICCVSAVVLLASSHPVAFVQSKLTQDKSLVSIPESEPSNPEPPTPSPKASEPSATTGTADPPTEPAAIIQDFKTEPDHHALSADAGQQVTFEADPEQTINSDTLHALVEQLRPAASPTTGLEQIIIIKTVDPAEAPPPPPQ